MAFRSLPSSTQMAKQGQKINPYPGVPDSVMKAKSTPATTAPKMKIKNTWGN